MILDGKVLALAIEKELVEKVVKLSRKPKLSIILVGDNVASTTYVRMKKKVAERIGIEVNVFELPSDISTLELKKLVTKLGQEETDGVMVQLPIPNRSRDETAQILELIPENKDVDGLSPLTLQKILTGKQLFLPATVKAIEKLLVQAGVTNETSVAVVGSLGAVGTPLVDRLKFLGFRIAKFDLGDSLARIKKFDVVVSATGKRDLIEGEMIKDGVVAIDVGFPYGDFNFATVEPKAKYITPVPGGVGPMTVICLMENVVEAGLK